MKNTKTSFIELLQIAVGKRAALTEPLNEEQWEAVMYQAKRQSLLGVCFEAVQRLPEEQLPPRQIRHKWYATTNKLNALNTNICSLASKLTARYADKGIRSCILKGVGVAALYPHPLNRQNGDIDIWLDCSRKEAIRATSGITAVRQVVYHHLMVDDIDSVEVEVHTTPSWLCNPFLNRRLQKWFAANRERQMNTPVRNYWNGSNEHFNSPDTAFELVYSMVHIFRHFCDEGVGLRHLLDYYHILMNSSAEERLEAVAALRSFGIGKFCSQVLYAIRAIFLLDEEYVPMETDSKGGERLLHEIWTGGNFGSYNPRNRHSASEGIVRRFLRKQKRLTGFAMAYPREVLWIPLWRVWHLLWRIRWNGLGEIRK